MMGPTEEDDYIEEDFEEDIPDSVNDIMEEESKIIDDDALEEELLRQRREKLERERKESNRLMTIKNTSAKSTRPISATYNLSS